MKKILSIFLVATMFASCMACSAQSKVERTDLNIDSVKEGYTRYDILEPNGRITEGFGAQFDTCVIEPQNYISEDDWNIQVQALKEMNLQCVRIRFYPEMYERGNDNDDPNNFDINSANVDFDSSEMKNLYKLLDVFQENNVAVDLSWYGCRTTFESEDKTVKGSWLGGKFGVNGVKDWMVEPTLGENPIEEFSESVAECLNYLLNTKKYTCINEYSLFPEPDGVIKNFENYKSICASVANRLKTLKITEIIFSGSADYSNNPGFFETQYLSQIDYKKATSSVYKFSNLTSNEEMLNFSKSYVEKADKHNISWGVAESGTSNFLTPVSNSDSDTFDRALFMARFMINFVNGGCTNIKYFNFSDCYYDGSLNTLGLFKFAHENYAAKPVFYSWSLITKYTERGSQIYPIESQDENVCMVAFKLPNNKFSYMITNNSPNNKKVAVVNAKKDRPSKMNLYKLTGASVPQDNKLKTISASSQVDTEDGVAYLTLSPNSFVVLSDK